MFRKERREGSGYSWAHLAVNFFRLTLTAGTRPRRIIDPQGREVLKRGYPGVGGRIRGTDALRRVVRRGTNLLGEPAAVLFRTVLARQIGSFRAVNPYAIDIDYWARLLAVSDLYVLEEALASFRISPTS